MGNRQFSNNASSILSGTITSVSTTIPLSTGYGALFPSPTGTEYFTVAIVDTSGNVEYVAITARSGDNLTVAPTSGQFPSGGRAQEGTTAQAFTANLARVELRDTAATLTALYQKDGDTLTGPMNLVGQTVTNGTLSTGISIEAATEIVNTPLRGATGATGNQITVPTDGASRAQAGGANILVVGDPIPAFTYGMVMLWNAAAGSIPAGWKLCDGTNGTPDLEDCFVIGAGHSYTLGQTGTETIATTIESGSPYTGTAQGHVLTTAELAVHAHPFDYAAGSGGVNYFGVPGFGLPAD